MESSQFEERYVEVCDLPYFTEPSDFYDRRMDEGMRIRELRFYAGFLFGKKPEEVDVKELKLAFLHKFPLEVDVYGSLIVPLLFPRRPFTIRRFIVAVIVYPLQSQARRPLTHVYKEVDK